MGRTLKPWLEEPLAGWELVEGEKERRWPVADGGGGTGKWWWCGQYQEVQDLGCLHS